MFTGPKITRDGLILHLDPSNPRGISPLGNNLFNGAPELIKNLVSPSDVVQSINGVYIDGLTYYTAFAIDYPENTYGGDAASRQGITPGLNVRSGNKLYDGSRALHLWVYDNQSNSWLSSSFFNGLRLSGHCYDSFTGYASWQQEVAQFVTDYNNIKSIYPNATYIVMGSHRDSGHTTDKINILLDLGAPSNVSSLLDGDPEWILVGKPGLGPGNAYGWAFENYSTDPTRVAHLNFGLPIYGSSGNYLLFDGSNDVVTVEDSSKYKLVGDKTLALWVYMGADSSGCGIAGKSNNSVAGMALGYGWNGNGFMALAWNSSNTPALSKDLSRDISKWVYLVATQNGNTRYIYAVDGGGIRSNTSTSGTHTWDNTVPVTIGNSGVGSSFAPGGTRVSNVMIYNRSLTESEVLQNFNATRGRFRI
jgi:hypothetical protein